MRATSLTWPNQPLLATACSRARTAPFAPPFDSHSARRHAHHSYASSNTRQSSQDKDMESVHENGRRERNTSQESPSFTASVARYRPAPSMQNFENEDEDDAASLILDPTGSAKPGQRPDWSETPYAWFLRSSLYYSHLRSVCARMTLSGPIRPALRLAPGSMHSQK